MSSATCGYFADLGAARTATLRMQGGAGGNLREATLDGRKASIRELVNSGLVWALNGTVSSMPAEPFFVAQKGETVRLTMTNETAWPHGMHLHGHHFRRLGADGHVGPLRDTILIDPGETGEVAFVADNPGDWLLHCHMLEHAVAGMRTWLRVAG